MTKEIVTIVASLETEITERGMREAIIASLSRVDPFQMARITDRDPVGRALKLAAAFAFRILDQEDGGEYPIEHQLADAARLIRVIRIVKRELS